MYVTVFNCVMLSVMVEVTVLSTVLVYPCLISQSLCDSSRYTYVVNGLSLHPGRDVSRRLHDSAYCRHSHHVGHCLRHGSRLDRGHNISDCCSLSVHQSFGLFMN